MKLSIVLLLGTFALTSTAAAQYQTSTGHILGPKGTSKATLLIETKTGRTWVLRDQSGKQVSWVPVPFEATGGLESRYAPEKLLNQPE